MTDGRLAVVAVVVVVELTAGRRGRRLVVVEVVGVMAQPGLGVVTVAVLVIT